MEGCIPRWEAEVRKKGGDGDTEDVDYVLLVRTVLVNAGYSK